MCDVVCDNGGTPDLAECMACDCPSGFGGNRCELDIDECSRPESCFNGVCTNTFGGYACTCNDGFTGERCDADINDCLNHDCQNGAVCVDRVSGYVCTCREGTSGDKCSECDITNCEKCNFASNPVQCSQCESDYSLNTDGVCGTSTMAHTLNYI